MGWNNEVRKEESMTHSMGAWEGCVEMKRLSRPQLLRRRSAKDTWGGWGLFGRALHTGIPLGWVVLGVDVAAED
jgi:hypothetical protein